VYSLLTSIARKIVGTTPESAYFAGKALDVEINAAIAVGVDTSRSCKGNRSRL